MDEKSFVDTIWEILNQEIFKIGENPLTAMTVVAIIAILICTLILSKLTRRAIKRTLSVHKVADEGTVGVITRLVHFVFLLIGFGIAVETAGIELGALFTAGAVFAVAIGFAVQNIVQNFVSGIILLLERVIKPGDVLEVDDQLVKVTQMGIRATVAQTLNREDLIIPNSQLVQSTVKNFMFKNSIYRLRASVGVTYDSDMNLVFKVLKEVAEEFKPRRSQPDPVVLLTEFGDNSVNFEVSIFIDKPWEMRKLKSELNFAIWNAFKSHEIVIAFPQVDVHFDKEITNQITQKIA